MAAKNAKRGRKVAAKKTGREAVDWVAAGKKAWRTRRANLKAAAKTGASA